MFSNQREVDMQNHSGYTRFSVALLLTVCLVNLDGSFGRAQPRRRTAKVELSYPPRLPGGKTVVTDRSDDFLKAPDTIKSDVSIATTPPAVDFLFYPGQDYPGKPWSNWGDSIVAGGKYYSAIGDHLAISGKGDGSHGTGTGFVFEYDPHTMSLRKLVDLADFLQMPKGHYTPGKIHSRLDMGGDGWLYYATHRGSARATTDQYFYQGDWILRTHPETGKSESIVRGPVPKHAIPNSVLDPDRMIFYGGTAAAN